jgi:site-specific DNA-methyltransferase (adenine-specific)
VPKIAYQDEQITLWHGDCREVMRDMPAESVDLIWTDPPYGHGNMDGDLQSARVGVKGARKAEAVVIANDTPDAMREVVDGMLLEAARVLRRDCCCCCCCCGGGGPSPTFAWLAQRMDQGKLSFFHSVVWDKTARGPGLGWRYRRDHEMVMVAHREGGRLRWADEDKATSNIVRIAPVRERQHPNEKPLALAQHFISLHSLPGDVVLDPFNGYGTTLIAALELGRRAIGIEIDERWIAPTICRIKAWRAKGRLNLDGLSLERRGQG